MSLKRYLRGLGIGIIVTALIIGISSNSKANRISDEEVISRAKELGMMEQVESNDLEDLDSSEVDSELENDSVDLENQGVDEDLIGELEVESELELIEDSTVLSEIEETVPEDVETDSNDINMEDESNIGLDEKEYEEEFVLLTIHSGESSNLVAAELESLQIIDNAADFDEYLCSMGYATRIHVGDHEIPVGATYEEIAEILCSDK